MQSKLSTQFNHIQFHPCILWGIEGTALRNRGILTDRSSFEIAVEALPTDRQHTLFVRSILTSLGLSRLAIEAQARIKVLRMSMRATLWHVSITKFHKLRKSIFPVVLPFPTTTSDGTCPLRGKCETACCNIAVLPASAETSSTLFLVHGGVNGLAPWKF